MNEHETIELLQRRQHDARIQYNPATVTHWQEALHDVDLVDATRALHAIMATGENDVSIPRIRSWLRSERRQETTGQPLGRPECPTCDGTGLTPRGNTNRYGPCPLCRPDTGDLTQPTEDTETFRFKVMDPDAVAARRAWFKAGMQGHYPDCPCDSCATRVRIQAVQ